MRRRRSAYTLFQLLVLLAFLLLLAGMLLPAIQSSRLAAARAMAQGHLKHLGLAVHFYHDSKGRLPAGVDSKGFSGLVHLLPYLEQRNLFRSIDLTKSVNDPANAAARATRIKTFESPLDPAEPPDATAGPTSCFLVAGSRMPLEGNNGVFPGGVEIRFTDIVDGLSNTLITLESLRGNGLTKPASVQRQHVRLGKESLEGLTESSGVKEFRTGKHLAGNRGAAWIDGRFLQSTINLTRSFDAAQPDVDCSGAGGLAGPRSLQLAGTNVGMGDGSVRFMSSKVMLSTWQTLATRDGNEPLPADF